LSSTTRTKRKKGIGDVTSMTIPTEYQDWITGEKKEVSEELLRMINIALSRRGLMHLVMTGISLVDENMKDIKNHNIGHKIEQVHISVTKIETLVRGLYEAKNTD